MIDEYLASRVPDPEVRRSVENRVFLLRVMQQIVEQRDAVTPHGIASDCVDFLHHHLPVVPFDTVDLLADIDHDRLTVGFFCRAREEIRLIDAVDDTTPGTSPPPVCPLPLA